MMHIVVLLSSVLQCRYVQSRAHFLVSSGSLSICSCFFYESSYFYVFKEGVLSYFALSMRLFII